MQFTRGVYESTTSLLSRHKVVVLEGARAVGKTTFVKDLGEKLGGSYIDLSNDIILTALKANPEEILSSSQSPVVIDEAQLLEELPSHVKRIVDRTKQPGQFLLTGSSSIGKGGLGGSDPLAGRSTKLQMYPLTVGERLGQPVNIVSSWFKGEFNAKIDTNYSATELTKHILSGGLPDVVLASQSSTSQEIWQLGQEVWPAYLDSVLSLVKGKYDVDRARLQQTIQYLSAVPSQIVNVARASNDLSIHQDTVRRYLEIGSDSMLFSLLKSLRPNAHKSLTAHPKLSVFDTGFAAWAAKVAPNDLLTTPHVWGGLVENFVSLELATQASWVSSASAVHHWRQGKQEVDCILVSPQNRYVAVEVKAASSVSIQDAKGVQEFQNQVGQKYIAGVVLYAGAASFQLADALWAVPISHLWSP